MIELVSPKDEVFWKSFVTQQPQYARISHHTSAPNITYRMYQVTYDEEYFRANSVSQTMGITHFDLSNMVFFFAQLLS